MPLTGKRISHTFLLFIATVGILFISTQAEDNDLTRYRRDSNQWTVTTIETEPYLVAKINRETGQKQFDGFIVDMMKLVGERLNQKYRFELVADAKFGSYDKSLGSWNGMIGEIVSGKADVAAAPVTITEPRRAVVSFTRPFMTFPTVLVLSKSTAGHATPSLKDILDIPDIRFGVIGSGATDNLIKSSSDPDLLRLRDRLESVETTSDGIQKARAGKFGLVLEGVTAEYAMKQEPCDLIKISLDAVPVREYALVAKKGSPDADRLSEVIDWLQSSGQLNELKSKWWSGPCSSATTAAVSRALLLSTTTPFVAVLLLKVLMY